MVVGAHTHSYIPAPTCTRTHPQSRPRVRARTHARTHPFNWSAREQSRDPCFARHARARARTTQKCSRNDPKIVQKWSKNDPKTIQKWSKNGPKTTKDGPGGLKPSGLTSWSSLKAVLGRLGTVGEASGSVLKGSWGVLAASWARDGRVLGRVGAPKVADWTHFSSKKSKPKM